MRLVGDLALGACFAGKDLRLFHGLEGLFRPVAQGVPQDADIRLAALLFQQVQHLPRAGDAHSSGAGGLRLHSQRPDLPQTVPQSGGENGFHRLEHCAEIPAPHPQRQVDTGLVQHRLRIQYLPERFAPRQLRLLNTGQDQALALLIAPTKGHHDPNAGDCRRCQRFRHQIAIRLINGIGRGADRNLYHVRGLHASPSSKCLFSGNIH